MTDLVVQTSSVASTHGEVHELLGGLRHGADPEDGEVHYRIMLSRDLIGWKVAGVELYFPSQN